MSSTVPGSILASKYELIEIAGQGGMATVWKARMHGAGGISRPVAVKLMHSRLSGDRHFVDLFIEEARVCSQLQHPNVVQILDFGEQDGTYYLAIEWVDGLDLLDYSRAFSKHGFFVPWMALVTIGVEVLKGMGAAHDHLDERGNPSPIIHRDVTPHNILLGVNGLVKLTDFGLAKATDRGSMTLPHVLKGKLSYTAPEMTQGAKASARTDLFSLGVTLWEALSGRKMFDAPSPLQIVRQIQAWKIPPLDSLRRDLPAELVRVVDRATARDPADRYESTHEMALALSHLLPSMPDLQRLGRSVVEARQRKNTELTEEQFQELSTELSSPLSAAPPKFSLASSPGSAARAARVQPRPSSSPPASLPPVVLPSRPTPTPRPLPSEPPEPARHPSLTAQRHTGMQPHGSTPKTPAAAPVEPTAPAVQQSSSPAPSARTTTQPPAAAPGRSTTQPQPAQATRSTTQPQPAARNITQPLGAPPVASPTTQGTPTRSTTQPQPSAQGAPGRSTTQPMGSHPLPARHTTQPQPAASPAQVPLARSITQTGVPAQAPSARSITQTGAPSQAPSARSITQTGAPSSPPRPSSQPTTGVPSSPPRPSSPPAIAAPGGQPASPATTRAGLILPNSVSPQSAPASARSGDTSLDDFSVLFEVEAPSSSPHARPTGAAVATGVQTPAPPATQAARPPEFIPPRMEQMSIGSLIETSLADFSIEVTVGSSLLELPPSLLSTPAPPAAHAAASHEADNARDRGADPGPPSAPPAPRGVAPTVTDFDLAPRSPVPPRAGFQTIRTVEPTIPDLEPPPPPVPAPPAPQDSIQEISTLFDVQDLAPPVAPVRPPPRPPPPRPPPVPPRRRE
jgi:serine/threonine-protein kinase